MGANGLGFFSNPYSRFPHYKVVAPIGARRETFRIFVKFLLKDFGLYDLYVLKVFKLVLFFFNS